MRAHGAPSVHLRTITGEKEMTVTTETSRQQKPSSRPLAIAAPVIRLAINVMAIPPGGHASELFIVMTAAILSPTLIAGIRRHKNRLALFVLCLLQIGILALASLGGS